MVFSKVKGIINSEVGFCQPTSKGFSKVEVVKIEYDPSIIDFRGLIDPFWETHNPKNPSNQDKKNPERSVLFYINEEQKKIAEEELNKKRASTKIFTSICDFKKYKKAPRKDQNYFLK